MIHRTFGYAVAIGLAIVSVSAQAQPPIEESTKTLARVFQEDLRYTPSYAYGVAVVRSAKISKLNGVMDLPGADLAGPNPMKPSEVERALMTIYPVSTSRSLGMGFVIQLRSNIAREKIVSWLSPNAKPLPHYKDVYFDFESRRPSVAVGFPEKQTIIVSSDPSFVVDAVKSRERKLHQHTLADDFAELDPDADAVAVFDLGKLSHLLSVARFTGFESFVDQLGPLKRARRVSVGINLSKPDGLVVRAKYDDRQAQKELRENVSVEISKHLTEVFREVRTLLPNGPAPLVASTEKRANKLLTAMNVTEDDGTIVLNSKQLPAAPETLEVVRDAMALYLLVVRQEALRLTEANNLRQVMLAIHNYYDTYLKFPRNILSDDGKPLLSWRVEILPWLGHQKLADQFRRDEPWDSEHNRKLLKQMPVVFRGRYRSEPNTTPIVMVTGNGTGHDAKTFDDIKGTSNTVALVTTAEPIKWAKPSDLAFDPKRPSKGLRKDRSVVTWYDGSVGYIDSNADHGLLRAAFLNRDGEVDHGRLADSIDPSTDELGDGATKDFDLLLADAKSGDEARIVAALTSLAFRQPRSVDRAQTILDTVMPQLKATSAHVRLQALASIAAYHDAGKIDLDVVATLLEDDYEANRWFAAQILSNYPKPKLVRAMARMPAHDFGVVRSIFYEEYATITADAMVPVLASADAVERAQACYLIAATGTPKHLPPLRKLQQDDDDRCRKAAKYALEKLQRLGPLATAVKELDGDVAAALKRVAKYVELDRKGHVIVVDLTQFDTPHRLEYSDYPILAKLKHLKSLKLTYSNITADGVAHLTALPLESLEINYCDSLTDEVAISISKMKSLIELDLGRTKVGDATMKAIGQLTQLNAVDVAETRLTDSGVIHLRNLRDLRVLNLSETKVTDAGIRSLTSLQHIDTLYLLDTELTDSCVDTLSKLRTLRFVNLRGSRLTKEGHSRLQRALPNCRGLGP